MLGWCKKVVELLKKCLKSIARKLELLLREECNMVDMYTALIIAGRRTLNQVPLSFRSQVEGDLLSLGLDENGQVI